MRAQSLTFGARGKEAASPMGKGAFPVGKAASLSEEGPSFVKIGAKGNLAPPCASRYQGQCISAAPPMKRGAAQKPRNRKEPASPMNTIWSFDLGKASIGEAVR